MYFYNDWLDNWDFALMAIVLTILIVLAFITSFFITAEASTEGRMQVVYTINSYSSIMYDTETKVMYLHEKNGGYTLMLDNEGQPLLYQKEGEE